MNAARLLLLGGLCAGSAVAQTPAPSRADTSAARSAAGEAPATGPSATGPLATGPVAAGPSPRAVLRRALVVPGWGQLSNRQPAKAVVAWGALAGTTGAAAFVHGRYREAGRAYLFQACTEVPSTCKVPSATTDYADDYARRYEGLSAASVRTSRDRLRRNRDLLILGVGLVYAFQAADAYVSAHLRDFDDDERLSLSLTPDGPSLGLRLTWP